MVCYLQVLTCGQDLPIWAPDPSSTARTYRDLIVRDKDIVKIVLLLTGSIEGALLRHLTLASPHAAWSSTWARPHLAGSPSRPCNVIVLQKRRLGAGPAMRCESLTQ